MSEEQEYPYNTPWERRSRERALLHSCAVNRGPLLRRVLETITKLKPHRSSHSSATFNVKPATWEEKQRYQESWAPDAKDYREFYADFLRYYFRYTPKEPSFKFVLDVGCGNYFWRTFRKYLHCFYTGVDPTAKPVIGVDYRVTCDAGENIMYPAESFDVVLFVSAIDHVKNVYGALSEIRRVLKATGVVWVAATVFKNRSKVDENYAREHMRWFTKASLLSLIRDHFQVVKVFKGADSTLYVIAKKKKE
jgi:SAM-dependent methyltransferase